MNSQEVKKFNVISNHSNIAYITVFLPLLASGKSGKIRKKSRMIFVKSFLFFLNPRIVKEQFLPIKKNH
jgi:hypothetical protein